MIKPVTIPDKPTSEPTDRSIPAVQITADMPSAMIPKKAKLRVILNRLRSVRNTSDTKDMTRPSTRIAMKTQNGWVRRIAPTPETSWRSVTLSSIAA